MESNTLSNTEVDNSNKHNRPGAGDIATYPKPLRVIHWLSAILIFSLLIIGFLMTNLPDGPILGVFYPLHKSLGLIALLLLLTRIPLRWRGPIPAFPEEMKTWETTLSHAAHLLLYVAMLGMALSGWIMNSTWADGSGVDMFGLFVIPDITPKSDYWNDICHVVHHYCAWGLVTLLSLHVAGVIKHRFFDKPGSDVLPRMM